MIENIKDSFYETLIELDWMDDDMKAFAKEKVIQFYTMSDRTMTFLFEFYGPSRLFHSF